MNYYEELGLTPSASAAEIRQAYKSLARLLHPDYQCDEQLRKVAELQMMRLHQILEVLIDPPERERYDASIRMALAGRHPLLKPEERAWERLFLGPVRIRIGAIGWGAALVLGAVALSFTLLYFERGSGAAVYQRNSPSRSTPSPAALPATPPIQENAATVPRARHPAKRAMKAARQESPRITQPVTPRVGNRVDSTRADEAPSTPAPMPDAVQALNPTAGPAGPIASNHKPVRAGCPFVGTWLYAKPGLDVSAGNGRTYRPEYIEMVVSEERGKIFGRYLGRFPISDQALSSEVSFTFHGTVGEGAMVLPWHNADGGEGQVRMQIVSDVEMEVAWYTTRFGTTRKLASGSAVLHRN